MTDMVVNDGNPIPVGVAERQLAERRFYSRMGLLLLALVLIGFGPSFYLKPLDLIHYPRPNPSLTPGVMVHGLMFSAWMAVFIAQTQLVAAGRRDLHRALGAAGMVLGAALLPVMYLTAVWQVARANQPPVSDPLTWTAVPLAGIPAFAALLLLGLRYSRRDLQAHKRLMLGLMIMVMQPALHRFPIFPPTLLFFVIVSILTWLLFVPLFLWDRRTIGRLHWATKLGAGLFAVVIAAQTVALAVPGLWAPIAERLPGVGA